MHPQIHPKIHPQTHPKTQMHPQIHSQTHPQSQRITSTRTSKTIAIQSMQGQYGISDDEDDNSEDETTLYIKNKEKFLVCVICMQFNEI